MSTNNELSLVESTVDTPPRCTPLSLERLGRAKRAFTTRRMPAGAARTLLSGPVELTAGDLVLARVDRIRQHQRLELPDGRRAQLFVGDEIIVTVGNRYAPDQFHAVVPERLGPCALVAAGGVAAKALARHDRMKPATEITLLGALGDDSGRILNLRQFALRTPAKAQAAPPVTAVLGTSMNSGKTASAVHLVRGLSLAGKRVGSAKITGTGAGGDLWRAQDAGATVVLDFTDAGHASTYCLPAAEIEQIFDTLLDALAAADVDAIVIEIADGVMHTETERLVASARFAARVDRVIFAAADAMGAVAGVGFLQELGVTPELISGAFTQAPLALREAGRFSPVPALSVDELATPRHAQAFATTRSRSAPAAA